MPGCFQWGCGRVRLRLLALNPEPTPPLLFHHHKNKKQPGCINWSMANRPPFRRNTGGLPRSLENATQACAVAKDALGLQLVSITCARRGWLGRLVGRVGWVRIG